jgi:RimJ/RimL family protein N-acetyltransferase
MTERITGKIVILRPATLDYRQPIFDCLTNSDLTKLMMGPPTYADSPIPGWQKFLNDYMEYFFDGSRPLLGRCYIIEVDSEPVGQINHDKISMTNHSTELDIWLKRSKYINKGYGTDVIVMLCNFLSNRFECKKFILSPSKQLNLKTQKILPKLFLFSS